MVGVKFSREITRSQDFARVVDNLIELYDPRIGSYTKYWAGEINLIINFIGITDFLYILRNGITIKYFIFLLERQLFYLENNR